jgi:diacylglycerol kinase
MIMTNFFRSRAKAIRYALEGWWYVIRTQKNTWVHALASIAAILMGAWLCLSRSDWAIIILTIALVWIVEVINTAIETLTDLISPQQNHRAKISKDVSAAAVLITAAAAVVVGLLILGPPLLGKIQSLNLDFR